MPTSLANLLTLSRIVAIPFFVAAFYLPGAWANWVAFAIFALASLTDWLDGWVARRTATTSALGRFLDPMADKLLVAAALLMLVADGRAPAIAALVIVSREILVSGLREFLAGRKVELTVSRLAKWKTAAQMVALSLLLVGAAAPTVGVPAWVTVDGGVAMLWIAVTLTLISVWSYLNTAVSSILAIVDEVRGEKAP